jgi:hypothetical protein
MGRRPNVKVSPLLRGAARARGDRGLTIVAHTIYRELSDYGYDDRQVVALAAELIGEVTSRRDRGQPAGRPPGQRGAGDRR